MRASHLDDGHAIATADFELANALSAHRRADLYAQAAQSLVQSVLFGQILQRLLMPALRLFLPPARQEAAAQGYQTQDAHRYAHNAHGGEREERWGRVTSRGERVTHDEVGRRTNQREHTAQAAGKSQGHEKARGGETGTAGHADHNGEHQGHRTRIADERTDQRGGQHEPYQQPRLAAAGQPQDAAAHPLGQTGGEDAAAHHEQAGHHDHNGIGETGQGFLGRQNAEKHQRKCGADGHQVGAKFARDKQQGGYKQDNQCSQHSSWSCVSLKKRECKSQKRGCRSEKRGCRPQKRGWGRALLPHSTGKARLARNGQPGLAINRRSAM